jgi:uncharacterized membrane protein
MEQTSPPNPTVQPIAEDKTVAIVAYLSIIGFIIALILHGQKKTALGAFHLRQMLGIIITGFCGGIIAWLSIFVLIGFVLLPAFYIFMFVMWLMGIIAAANGEMKPAPLLGKNFQEWFKNTFS